MEDIEILCKNSLEVIMVDVEIQCKKRLEIIMVDVEILCKKSLEIIMVDVEILCKKRLEIITVVFRDSFFLKRVLFRDTGHKHSTHCIAMMSCLRCSTSRNLEVCISL